MGLDHNLPRDSRQGAALRRAAWQAAAAITSESVGQLHPLPYALYFTYFTSFHRQPLAPLIQVVLTQTAARPGEEEYRPMIDVNSEGCSSCD